MDTKYILVSCKAGHLKTRIERFILMNRSCLLTDLYFTNTHSKYYNLLMLIYYITHKQNITSSKPNQKEPNTGEIHKKNINFLNNTITKITLTKLTHINIHTKI